MIENEKEQEVVKENGAAATSTSIGSGSSASKLSFLNRLHFMPLLSILLIASLVAYGVVYMIQVDATLANFQSQLQQVKKANQQLSEALGLANQAINKIDQLEKSVAHAEPSDITPIQEINRKIINLEAKMDELSSHGANSAACVPVIHTAKEPITTTGWRHVRDAALQTLQGIVVICYNPSYHAQGAANAPVP